MSRERRKHSPAFKAKVALEIFRNSYPRRWATVPAAPGKDLSFDGHEWQRNVATGVWFNEVSDRLKVTGHEADASLYAMYHEKEYGSRR